MQNQPPTDLQFLPDVPNNHLNRCTPVIRVHSEETCHENMVNIFTIDEQVLDPKWETDATVSTAIHWNVLAHMDRTHKYF